MKEHCEIISAALGTEINRLLRLKAEIDWLGQQPLPFPISIPPSAPPSPLCAFAPLRETKRDLAPRREDAQSVIRKSRKTKLAPSRQAAKTMPPRTEQLTNAENIKTALLSKLRDIQPARKSDLAAAVDRSPVEIQYHLRNLVKSGQVAATGATMNRRYSLPEKAEGKRQKAEGTAPPVRRSGPTPEQRLGVAEALEQRKRELGIAVPRDPEVGS